MNIITDTLDEIRKMKFRKVSHTREKHTDIAAAAGTELRHDRMLGADDMEDAHDRHQHGESGRGRTQVSQSMKKECLGQ